MPVPRPARAVVFAHRGASALRPEHTLAAYAQAIADGADFVEPDLVATRDGVLVARHDATLSGSTDVAAHPRFAARRATRTIDGRALTDWFVADFTLAELKALRAREPWPEIRSARFDGTLEVPTWDEIVTFVAAESARTGRDVGLVPELKHPSYHRALRLALEEPFLASLDAHEYLQRAPLVVQSFEVGNLRALHATRPGLALMQLLGRAEAQSADGVAYGALLSPTGLREVATYAQWIGVRARAVVPLADDGAFLPPTTLVADAHAAGLRVAAYTFRPEQRFLPRARWRDENEATWHEALALEEMRACLDAGVDALFTDAPALGRRAVDDPR